MSKPPERESFRLSRKGFSRLPQNAPEDSSSEELELGVEAKKGTVGRRWSWRDTGCCFLLFALLVVVVLLAVGGGLLYTRLSVPGLVLKVNATLLERSGDWLTVSWEGVAGPSGSDWIGVYSPPVDGGRIDAKNHAPIKYQYASHAPSHLQEGRGSLQLRLINMRSDVIIGFFRNGLAVLDSYTEFNDPVAVAVSDKIQFRNWNEPLQGHLALTGNPTEMILVWVTRNTSSPQVKWGTKSGAYSFSKQASSGTYTAEDMCGSPATDFGYRDAGLQHQVTMDNLTPGAQYFYKFGDIYGWSEEYSFRAAPTPGPNARTRVIAYGDMGVGNQDGTMAVLLQSQAPLNTVRLLKNQLNQTDVILHIGDISYAMGYASVWDDFFDEIQPIATRVPYMVCIGNHERDWANTGSYYNGTDSSGECGVPHERRFPMPRPSLDEPWYGFDYGSIHFVLMSTEHDFRKNSNQYRFLDSHLKGVNRSLTPWLVFAGHRPMYIDSTNAAVPDGDLTVASLLRENVEPLLKEYSVDLALWGHHHSYQRTCPVYDEVCTEGATTHIVIGMGGKGLSKNLQPETPKWIGVLDDEHWGYSRFTANATVLLFEYVRDSDGQVHDVVMLEKL